MKNYAPRPGSMPARAIDHLKTLAPGTELTAPVLADALDVDAVSISSCLEFACRNGLLRRDKREGRVYWSLGDGVPPPAPEDDDPPVQRVVAATTGGVALTDIARWPGLDTPSQPIVIAKKPRRGSAKTAPLGPRECQDGTAGADRLTSLVPYDRKPGPRSLRVALWSDGQLQIQRGDFELILLAPDETRQLVKYLERMAESADA